MTFILIHKEGITEWLTQKCFGGAYRGTIGQFPESTLSNLSLVDSSFNECLVSIKQKNIELKKEQEKPLSTETKSFREQYSLPEEEKQRLAIYSKETAERIATETPQPNLSQEEYTY